MLNKSVDVTGNDRLCLTSVQYRFYRQTTMCDSASVQISRGCSPDPDEDPV